MKLIYLQMNLYNWQTINLTFPKILGNFFFFFGASVVTFVN